MYIQPYQCTVDLPELRIVLRTYDKSEDGAAQNNGVNQPQVDAHPKAEIN